jgi:protein gp37
MGANSKIAWTNHTFNPWTGCTKVSPGCANCYAEGWAKRSGLVEWGPGKPRRRTSEGNWKQPVKWNRVAELAGQEFERAVRDTFPNSFARPFRPRVFCASLADWLDDAVPDQWLADLLDLIRQTPNLDWLLLTKRPQNWRDRIEAIRANIKTFSWACAWLDGIAPANVWIGTTCEDQTRADERIPHLLKIPARVRFLSCEPLLEKLSLSDPCFCPDWTGARIHWVIGGGESGPRARALDVRWLYSLRDQCQAAGVAYFNKQLGAKPYMSPEHDGATGYALAVSDPAGADPEEWPVDLRVQTFPGEVAP